MVLRRTFLKLWYVALILLPFGTFTPIHGQVIKDIRGHSGSSFSKEQFKRALGQATTKVNHTAVLKLERGQLKGIDSKSEIETEASQGSWRIILTGWRVENGDDVIIKKGASVVMNYGHKMQYVFFSQDIPDYVYDRVDQKLEKLKKNIIKEYKDVTVEFGRNENQVMFVAEYPYSNGANSGKIKDRLVFYMNESRSIINKSMEETEKQVKSYRKELENRQLTKLTRDEFMAVVRQSLEKKKLKEVAGTLGAWEFKRKKCEFEIHQYDDRIMVSTYRAFPKGLPQEVRDALIQQITAQVTDKPAKGASSMDVVWYPEYEHYIWVKANYPLDGQVKGKDIQEWASDFLNDYGQDLYKDLGEVLKDHQANIENQPLTHLTSTGFMQLMNDGLDDYLKEHAEAKDGLWEFHINDNWFELHNYGNRVMLTLYQKLPESVSKDSYPDILAKVEEKIEKKQAKNASHMAAEWYPEYPDVIWVKADYPFDGNLKAKDLKEAYHDFLYDYGKNMHKEVAKIIKKYD